MAQLVSVFIYLKMQNIVYQDLHTGNIMINPTTFHVKVIDFGVSKFMSNNSGMGTSNWQNINIKVPELLNISDKDYEIDLFA